MLILTRRIGEVVCIGNDIRVTIVDTKGNQVRLGIQAPPDVPVDREEVFLRKKGERKDQNTGQQSFEKNSEPEAALNY